MTAPGRPGTGRPGLPGTRRRAPTPYAVCDGVGALLTHFYWLYGP